jgi:ABC-2 type transport system permease protein
MNKLLVVAVREFRQRVRKRGFLLSSIATPLVLLIIWAVTGFSGQPASQQPLADLRQAAQSDSVFGYVDQANLIHSVPAPIPAGLFRAFPDVQAARVALERGQIDAYYVIPADYRDTGDVRRFSRQLSPDPPDVEWFNWVLVSNLMPDTTPEQVARLRQPFAASGPEYVSINPEGQTGPAGSGTLPFLVTIAIMVPLFTSGSYLFQSLTQEKSSRTMEILLVSLRPRQLLTGKLLGLGALTLVQYVVWFIISGLVLGVTGRQASQLLSGINFSGTELVLAVLFALGGYTLYAALMAGIGAMSPDVENSRVWIFVVSLPMLIPIYLWMAIVSSPNGLLALVLSLIPFSAPVAMLMRMTSTVVPMWQIGLSLILLLVTGIAMIRLMARLFRAQILLSGESLSVPRFWSALTS